MSKRRRIICLRRSSTAHVWHNSHHVGATPDDSVCDRSELPTNKCNTFMTSRGYDGARKLRLASVTGIEVAYITHIDVSKTNPFTRPLALELDRKVQVAVRSNPVLTSSFPSPESSHGAPQCNSSTYRTPSAAAAAPRPPTLPAAVDPATAANRFSRSLSSPSERSALIRFMVVRKLSAAVTDRESLQTKSEGKSKTCLSTLKHKVKKQCHTEPHHAAWAVQANVYSQEHASIQKAFFDFFLMSVGKRAGSSSSVGVYNSRGRTREYF